MSCVCCSTLNVTVGLYVTVILNYYGGVAIWKSLTSFCLALTGERAPIRDIWSYLFCLHGTVWNLFGFWWGGIQRGIQSPCGYHEISGLPKKKNPLSASARVWRCFSYGSQTHPQPPHVSKPGTELLLRKPSAVCSGNWGHILQWLRFHRIPWKQLLGCVGSTAVND